MTMRMGERYRVVDDFYRSPSTPPDMPPYGSIGREGFFVKTEPRTQWPVMKDDHGALFVAPADAMEPC